MIIFEGFIIKNSVQFLIFSKVIDDIKTSVEVPVDKNIADRIIKYIGVISPPIPILVERGNDEEQD